MTARKTLLLLCVTALCVAVAGCTDSNVDDADSAPVVFEVSVLGKPPVQATLDQATGNCVFVVTDWTATALNVPKNGTAITSPFNDIELLDMTVSYTCVSGQSCPPDRTFGITGTVPANGSVGFIFPPILLDDLDVTQAGTTLLMDMTFRSTTVAGDNITYFSSDTLPIAACI